MFRLAEYRSRAQHLSDFLPWVALVAPGVVLNKDGAFQRTARFRGPDLDSSTASELVGATARLNNALRRLGSGWAVFVEAQRRPAVAYPASTFPDPVSALVDTERRAQFEAEGAHFESAYSLTFAWLPPAETARRAERWMYEGSPKSGDDAGQLLAGFVDRTERVLELLADQPLAGGLQPRLGSAHLRVLTVMGFPTATWPGILDELNRLAFPYRWSTRAICLDKTDATKMLTKVRRQWFAKRKSIASIIKEVMTNEASALTDSDAANKAADADLPLQEPGSDLIGQCLVTATVTVWDEDARAADDKLRLVEKTAPADLHPQPRPHDPALGGVGGTGVRRSPCRPASRDRGRRWAASPPRSGWASSTSLASSPVSPEAPSQARLR